MFRGLSNQEMTGGSGQARRSSPRGYPCRRRLEHLGTRKFRERDAFLFNLAAAQWQQNTKRVPITHVFIFKMSTTAVSLEILERKKKDP